MSAMLDQRTMQRPGEGIVREVAPTTTHAEFPKHMVHPGFQAGAAGEEIKLLRANGQPSGSVICTPGKSVRYPPVLVFDADQEELHVSLGYSPIGRSDPAAFARAVAESAPVSETHVPVEYPKWINGRTVHSAEEEAEALGHAEPAGEPAVETEVNALAGVTTDDVAVVAIGDEIAALEAKLAALRVGWAGAAARAYGATISTEATKAIADAMLMVCTVTPIVETIAAPEIEPDPAPPEAAPADAADEITHAIATEVTQEVPREMTRGEAIRAGKARAAAARAGNDKPE